MALGIIAVFGTAAAAIGSAMRDRARAISQPDPSERVTPQPIPLTDKQIFIMRGIRQTVPDVRAGAMRDLLAALEPGHYATDTGTPNAGSVSAPATTALPQSSVMSAGVSVGNTAGG